MEFEYGSKPWLLLLCVVMFGGMTVGLWFAAGSRPEEVRILTAEFYGTQGVVILYILCAASAAFTVFGLVAFIASFKMDRKLILTEDSLTLPKSPLRRIPSSVRFADITALKPQNVMGQQMLEIIAATGKLTIAKQALRGKGNYEKVVDYITTRSPNT